MCRDEVRIIHSSESETVEKEEAKYHEDAYENAIPQLPIHAKFYSLFTYLKILHREIQGVQRPDVKGRQSASQREDDE